MTSPNLDPNDSGQQRRSTIGGPNYGQFGVTGDSPSKPSWFSNWMPALFLLVLVFGLVLFVGFKSEVAKWYVADANNALRAGNIERYEASLSSAKHWDPKIFKYVPFLTVQLEKLMIDGTVEDVEQFLSAIPDGIDAQAVSNTLAQSSNQKGQFEIAFLVMKYAERESERPLGPELLNQHAYWRAIAGKELDIALEQINKAIADGVPTLGSFSNTEMLSESAYRDTRAWVLYRLERYQDALDEINAAIELRGKVYSDVGIEFEPLDKPPETRISINIDRSSPEFVTARHIELQQYLRDLTDGAGSMPIRPTFDMGVFRFHRLKILESLGEEPAAEADRKWLEEHNLTEPAILH